MPKVKSEPKVTQTVLNEYNQKVASEPDRTVPLGDLDGLHDTEIKSSEKYKISELSLVVKHPGTSVSARNYLNTIQGL